MPVIEQSPQRIFETLDAYRRTAALKAAIELDIFTAIGESANTSSLLARRLSASERGLRVFVDYLTMLGFLKKDGAVYSLAPDAAAFLDRRSPTYLGTAAAQMESSDSLVQAFTTLAEAVCRGQTALPAGGTLAPEHPVWVDFARAASIPGKSFAQLLADSLYSDLNPPAKLLDIAAGHGLYGIEFAKRNPRAEVYAVDWPDVLTLAQANALTAGVADRFHPIPGDALRVDLGTGYDLALITNFLPDLESTTNLLKRIYSALEPAGRIAIFELMLNDDRTSPAAAVALNLTLLATTPGGETRTSSELAKSLEGAGFTQTEVRELPRLPNRVMIARR